MKYEFKCEVCGRVFVVDATLRQYEKLKPCPTCAGTARVQVGGAGFVLKGAGWARDGYTGAGK